MIREKEKCSDDIGMHTHRRSRMAKAYMIRLLSYRKRATAYEDREKHITPGRLHKDRAKHNNGWRRRRAYAGAAKPIVAALLCV